uniref:MIT domain-containing protein n=1 Tax=Alexandrium catenella TaxID=2925 RepID=A0A7S1WSP7_ALECA
MAFRRITSLLSVARRADSHGDYAQARELYSEVLKVQRALAGTPLGNLGPSLREATAGVEARLLALQQEPIQEGEVAACGSSRPATNGSMLSSGSKVAPVVMQFAPQGNISIPSCWDTGALPECPLSAREGINGRPTTRDGLRPGTQEGSRRCSRTADGRRPLSLDGEWVFREEGGQQQLEGMRPSTRDGARLQQLIDGTARKQEGARQRPHTRDGARDGQRPPAGGRRNQEALARQSSSRRRRHVPSGPEALGPELLVPPSGLLGPCVDAEDSVELLE